MKTTKYRDYEAFQTLMDDAIRQFSLELFGKEKAVMAVGIYFRFYDDGTLYEINFVDNIPPVWRITEVAK